MGNEDARPDRADGARDKSGGDAILPCLIADQTLIGVPRDGAFWSAIKGLGCLQHPFRSAHPISPSNGGLNLVAFEPDRRGPAAGRSAQVSRAAGKSSAANLTLHRIWVHPTVVGAKGIGPWSAPASKIVP